MDAYILRASEMVSWFFKYNNLRHRGKNNKGKAFHGAVFSFGSVRFGAV